MRAELADHAAEVRYLGALLHRPENFHEHHVPVADIDNRLASQTLASMHAVLKRAEDLTPFSLQAELERTGVKREAAIDFVLTVTNVVEYQPAPVARRLRELAELRRMREGALRLIASCERGVIADAREARGALTLVHEAIDGEQPVMTLGEMLHIAAEAVLREGTEQRAMIPLGMGPIDESFKLSAASTIVVGAQTNVGKTSVILTWLLNVCRTGLPVGLVSVEDPTEDYGAKALGAFTAINPARMWMAKLTPQERALIVEVAGRHSALPFSFAFVRSRSLDEVLARIEFMVRVRGARVIALDYLQAIDHRPGNSPRERIDNSLSEIVALCGRLNVGLILASQLSRPDKGSPFKEPHLSDLKESGNIEIRAQCVVLLWRENDKPGAIVKAKVAKVKRVGLGARFELDRDPDTGMLVDASTLKPREQPARQRSMDEDEEWGA